MSTKQKTYKIKTGDCLSLIEKKFGLPSSTLIKLNSDQIQNKDLIFAGDEIVIESGATVVARTELPKAPDSLACGNTVCSAKRPLIVDVLYIPSHPETGKQAWYGLTVDAQKAITDEMDLLGEAIKVDKKETIESLTNLGILSKFTHKGHEHFLNAEDAEHLRFVSSALSNINLKAADNYIPEEEGEEKGEIGFLLAIAENENFGFFANLNIKSDAEKRKIWVEAEKKSRPGPVQAKEEWYYTPFGLASEEIITEASAKNKSTLKQEKGEWYFTLFGPKYKEVITKEEWAEKLIIIEEKIKKNVVEGLEGIKKNLEDKAKKEAKNKQSKDGTHFIYDNDCNYYTSKIQTEIAKCIKSVIRGREWNDDDFKNKGTKTAGSFKTLWDEKIPLLVKHYGTDMRGTDVTLGQISFFQSLIKLNAFGYVVKEQCLSSDDLVGSKAKHFGPEVLSKHPKYKNWRDEKKLVIDIDHRDEIIDGMLPSLLPSFSKNEISENDRTDASIKTLLADTRCAAVHWAYYPTLALIRLIDTTLSVWLKDINAAAGVAIPDMFTNLIWIKRVALARVEQLKKKAIGVAKSGGENITGVYIKRKVPSTPFTLLWDESKFKPAKMDTGFFKNSAGKANIQVVECSLLSKKGEVSWVRGPCWYMPIMGPLNNKSNGHVVDITSPVTGALRNIPQEEAVVSKLLSNVLKKVFPVNMKGELVSYELGKVEKKLGDFDSKEFWKNDYHWQGALIDGKPGYSVHGESQFLRFTAKGNSNASSSLDWPDSGSVKPSLSLAANLSVEANLTLASGKLSFNTWFPKSGDSNQSKEPKSGLPLQIPYAIKGKNGQAVSSEKPYDAGELLANVEVSVFGVAAVSLALSGELSIGPSATDGGIGVKGKAFDVNSYNAYEDKNIKKSTIKGEQRNAPAALPTSVAAQGSVRGNCFAGVEAGGSLSAEVRWKPPSESKGQNEASLLLGKVGYEASASFGVGASGEFTLALHGGQLVFVMAGKLVMGPGVSGKFAFQLEAGTADQFISCLLGMLSKSGFMYIEAFGNASKGDTNSAFAFLNRCLTLALMLGIGLVEVLLMPFKLIDSFYKDALQEKYAPMIAGHILDAKKLYKNKKWIRNLPPETLAPLLTCLLNQADKGGKDDKEQDKYLSTELSKANAVAEILGWISKLDKNDKGEVKNCCIQFEKTMFLMGAADRYSPIERKWVQFGKSWEMFEDFMLNIQSLITVAADSDRSTYVEVKKKMTDAIKFLAQNMQGYRVHLGVKDPVRPNSRTIVYRVYRKEVEGETLKQKEARDAFLKFMERRDKIPKSRLLMEEVEKMNEWEIR